MSVKNLDLVLMGVSHNLVCYDEISFQYRSFNSHVCMHHVDCEISLSHSLRDGDNPHSIYRI